MIHSKAVSVIFWSIIAGMLALGCSPKINVFPDYSDPMQEVTLSGKGNSKILVVPITGFIDNHPRQGFFYTSPSTLEESVSMLKKARQDQAVKGVILQIDTPGGTASASDILHHEITRFKEETGKPVVAMMMSTATSGGYLAAVACDRIVAHPGSITGSIGVVFIVANVEGLFDKIGVEAEAIKSGKHKDMGSPFRDLTDEERALFQGVIDHLHERFISAVKAGRPTLSDERIRRLADGRIYTAEQALGWELIDKVGYYSDAVDETKKLAGLEEEVRLVTYRRTPRADDNVYNTITSNAPTKQALVDFGISRHLFVPRTGFYYVWEPALEQ